MQRQHEIMTRLSERRNVDSCGLQLIFDELSQAACEGLNVSRASIWLCSDDCSKVLCASAYSACEGLHDIFDEVLISACPNYLNAMESGSVVQSQNVKYDTKTSELLTTGYILKNTEALLHLPIWLEGESIGYLCCEQVDKAFQWTPADQAFVNSVAHHIAMAMANCKRSKAEQLLKESEQRYELAVKGSNDGLWDWDLSSNKVYRSAQFKKLLGYRDNELVDEDGFFASHLHPDDERRARAALDAHLTDADIDYEDEFRLKMKTGKYRWFRCRGNALRDEKGKPYRVSGSLTDIDEFKYVQRSLNRFKDTLGEVTENIFMFDPVSLKFFYVNKSAINDWGYSEAELMSMTLLDIKVDATREKFSSLLESIIASEKLSRNFEAVYMRKNGEKIDVEVNLKYIAPANSAPRFVGIVRDISQRKLADIENYIQRTMLENISKVQDEFISSGDRRPDFTKLLNVILDITESEFGLVGEIAYLENETSFIKCRYIGGVSQGFEKINHSFGQSNEVENLNSLLDQVIEKGNFVIVNEVENSEIDTDFPDRCPALESYMGIPLKVGDELIGIIGIANRKEAYKEEIIQQLQPLLSTCANLLDAERAEILRNTMEAALVEAKEEAERANLTKSQFLSNMSHELRTPLNAIMGFSQLLQLDSQLTKKQQKHSSVIHSAGSLLLALINDVLDLAKIESDQIDLLIEAVPLDDLLKECFRFIKPMAEKRGIELILSEGSGDSDDEVWVLADNTRLKQVLLNLLSNAIKYNKDSGSVTVSCETGPQCMCRISIEDSGKGIAPENMEKLFQPFNRLGEQQGETEGTGIGLVITRKLIELMGGAIHVESEYGRGSTFIIDIPVADIDKTRCKLTCEEYKIAPDESSNTFRILVAEDNLINQELITLQLHSLGYTSAVVNNGNEAFAELQEHDYDLLLTDIHMPGMGGHELTQVIRESKSNRIRNITIIAVTANAANNEAESCLASGMNDYLSKPVDRCDLKNKLNRWLTVIDPKGIKVESGEFVSGEQVSGEHFVEVSPEYEFDTAIDMSQLNRYIGKDISRHKRFFDLFLKTTPESINALHIAYNEHSFSDIGFYSHKIKSSTHTLGLTGLSLLCQQLELAAENADWDVIESAMFKLDDTVSAVDSSIHTYLSAFENLEGPAGLSTNKKGRTQH